MSCRPDFGLSDIHLSLLLEILLWNIWLALIESILLRSNIAFSKQIGLSEEKLYSSNLTSNKESLEEHSPKTSLHQYLLKEELEQYVL